MCSTLARVSLARWKPLAWPRATAASAGAATGVLLRRNRGGRTLELTRDSADDAGAHQELEEGVGVVEEAQQAMNLSPDFMAASGAKVEAGVA